MKRKIMHDIIQINVTGHAAQRDSSTAQALGGALGLASAILPLIRMSSKRFKDYINTIGRIGKLKLVSFRYKGYRTEQIGFIAEEVERYYPEAILYDRYGRPTMINYSNLLVSLNEV